MLFVAGYAFAFAGCVLLALCRPRHALAIWTKERPMPRRWGVGLGAALALGMVLACMAVVDAYDSAMALIATLCLILLAAIGMTLLLGLLPRRLLFAAKLAVVVALLFMALHLGAAP